ncbi:EAL domain-containing protein [Pseudomonas sp. H9]|uniref:EAL domain-containing response regulator n=1 Tax=Pseudomonas sp. H9 TaxID=483968 RepID=UPI0010576AD5|nr:EAL domain-containing response regulator [Pseudomonas sp. H9]TDF78327.1 EAL domain-containing protein [Pseudomonas sp. H9]
MRSLKVLILEDHPFQLMALHQMLNANGVFDVLAADTVEVACQALDRRGHVDIAICDLQIEGADGLELIRHMAENHLARALIILSGAEACVIESVAALAEHLGLKVLGAMQKPANSLLVNQLLRRYLELDQDPGEPKAAEPRPAPELLNLSATELAQSKEQWMVYYQPKVCLDGQLRGAEALVRWQHPQLGTLSPALFFPLLERANLIATLTWHVLDQALAFSAQCQDQIGSALPVAVNITPQLLLHDDFYQQVKAALHRHAVPPSALTLEIIETAGSALNDQQLEGLLHLRILGCQLSIDDFGMGESNVQRLLELPFSELKLPSEFVRGMSQDARKAAVVAGALIMARRMSLNVVVEGVESADDLQAIAALGQPVIQGYFIARPMPGAELLNWIASREQAGIQHLANA